eukprot:scaffold175131_cov18-Tisochrysis_lutea.AAC.2
MSCFVDSGQPVWNPPCLTLCPSAACNAYPASQCGPPHCRPRSRGGGWWQFHAGQLSCLQRVTWGCWCRPGTGSGHWHCPLGPGWRGHRKYSLHHEPPNKSGEYGAGRAAVGKQNMSNHAHAGVKSRDDHGLSW